MIFEMRTYLMKPGSIPKVEELFGAGMPARTKLSRFGGFWRTEVGTLNQIIHVWPYKDLNERDHTRAEAIRTGVWPPKIADNPDATTLDDLVRRGAKSIHLSLEGTTHGGPWTAAK